MKSLLPLIAFLAGALGATAQTPVPIGTPLPSLPITAPLRRGSTTLVLGAVLSARVELAPGTAPQIVGFVVGGKSRKNLLLRAVGPSLAQFGIAKPAALPRLRYYDSAGEEFVSSSAGFPPDWDAIFASAGAFPLTGGERAGDAYTTVSLDPGLYSVHVFDDAKLGGTALVEVYELP